MSATELAPYLERPLTPPDPPLLEQIEHGPIDPGEALALSDVDRLLDPLPEAAESGWCWLPNGVGYVAVRSAMPSVTGEMLDWWFDWHPDDPIRYRIWHPLAHIGNSIQRPPGAARSKAHWDTVHHPVEDVGTGVAHARISFLAPERMGMSSNYLEDPRVATIVCGYVGDDTRHMRHSVMFHVVLRAEAGSLMRSRFWLGAALRAPDPVAGVSERILNRRAVRRRVLPANLPHALARHCAEEYANLAAILPELYARFGPGGEPSSRVS